MIFCLLALYLLTDATAVPAQPSGLPHRFEITPFGGYSWTFARSACFGATCGDLDIKSSGFWGLAFDVNGLIPGGQLEFLYNRQDSKLTYSGLGFREDVTDIAVEYYHVGILRAVPMNGVLPFGGATFGATRFNYKDGALGDDWKFSVIVSGGAKVYASERLGLRFQARLPITILSGGAGLGCGLGGCYTTVGGFGIGQIDLSAGLAILL
jgi:hypothetical protein